MSDDDSNKRDPTQELAELMNTGFAGSLRPDTLPADSRNRIRARIGRGVRERSMPGTRTIRADEDNWQPAMPGVRVRMLREDKATGSQTFLVRMDPGAEFPEHLHPMREEFLVLRGDLQIGDQEFDAGDAHFAESGSTHATLRTRAGVVLLVRMGNPEA